MKRFLKIFVNLLAVIIMATACIGLVGCKGEKVTVQFTVEVYDYEQEEMIKDATLTMVLHRYLAPKTVDNMVKYIKAGYYDDVIFYANGSNKIMFGDLKMEDNGTISQNEIMPTVDGEFENGSVKGNDLEVKEGNIALWRTWGAGSEYGYTSNYGNETGRATWFMPTSSISSYNGYFCVFGTMDIVNNSTNADTWSLIKEAVNNHGTTYTVYYTGTYDVDKPDENNGLEFHCEQDVDEPPFDAEGDQYACYDQYDVTVAEAISNSPVGARIVSAKVF